MGRLYRRRKTNIISNTVYIAARMSWQVALLLGSLLFIILRFRHSLRS